MADDPKLTDHWKKVVFLLLFMALWLCVSVFIFGGHRIASDFIPLDASAVGANVLASFVWLPIAFLGGWIVSEVRNARNRAAHKEDLKGHEERMVQHLEEHHMKMADLLGIASPNVADALNSTPGDRRLDDV